MSKIYDVIIVGAGPAGLTAAIYAKRAMLDALLIERFADGGQILNTYEVDNYPGFPGISGAELGMKFSEHADKFNIEKVTCEVCSMELSGDVKTVVTDEGSFEGKSVILATGASPRKLGVPGEEELMGCGVSYCATCDGTFFKNREVAVVGGGDVAVEDAIFLARGCKKVYLIHRRNELRATKVLQAALFGLDNVEVIWDSVVKSINGEDMVESVTVTNVQSQAESVLNVNGLFVATGNEPNSSYVKNADNGVEVIKCDSKGFLIADETCATNVQGVFAAGDVRTKKLRQVSTAVADGANAVYSVQEYLLK